MVNSLIAQFRRLRRGQGSGLAARDWAELVADPGSFHRAPGWRGPAAVLTGGATIEGHPVVLVISDFEVQAGTLGVQEGDLVAGAFDHATAAHRPVLAICASGGVRQQEGVVGFLQMVKAIDAVRRHRDAGNLYVSYLSQPTTGGVFASWGSLSQVTWAAPGALIGFTGPKVVEMLTGHQELRGVQSSENLFRHGLLDDLFAATELRGRMATLLRALSTARPEHPPAPAPAALETGVTAWESVRRTRDPERSSSRELLKHALSDFTILRGDRAGGKDDPACLAMIGRFLGRPVVVVGNDRGLGVEVERIGVSGLRKARRGLRLAGHLRLPALALIDTPGAETSAEAEEDGLAQGIAHCISTMLEVRTPVVTAILGQGSGGGALALLPGDRVLAAEHAWLSPISPEGASAIVHGTVTRASEMAEAQGIVASRLLEAGIVDTVVPEAGGELVARMTFEIARALDQLSTQPDGVLARRRSERYRRIGGSSPALSTL